MVDKFLQDALNEMIPTMDGVITDQAAAPSPYDFLTGSNRGLSDVLAGYSMPTAPAVQPMLPPPPPAVAGYPTLEGKQDFWQGPPGQVERMRAQLPTMPELEPQPEPIADVQAMDVDLSAPPPLTVKWTMPDVQEPRSMAGVLLERRRNRLGQTTYPVESTIVPSQLPGWASDLPPEQKELLIAQARMGDLYGTLTYQPKELNQEQPGELPLTERIGPVSVEAEGKVVPTMRGGLLHPAAASSVIGSYGTDYANQPDALKRFVKVTHSTGTGAEGYQGLDLDMVRQWAQTDDGQGGKQLNLAQSLFLMQVVGATRETASLQDALDMPGVKQHMAALAGLPTQYQGHAPEQYYDMVWQQEAGEMQKIRGNVGKEEFERVFRFGGSYNEERRKKQGAADEAFVPNTYGENPFYWQARLADSRATDGELQDILAQGVANADPALERKAMEAMSRRAGPQFLDTSDVLMRVPPSLGSAVLGVLYMPIAGAVAVANSSAIMGEWAQSLTEMKKGRSLGAANSQLVKEFDAIWQPTLEALPEIAYAPVETFRAAGWTIGLPTWDKAGVEEWWEKKQYDPAMVGLDLMVGSSIFTKIASLIGRASARTGLLLADKLLAGAAPGSKTATLANSSIAFFNKRVNPRVPLKLGATEAANAADELIKKNPELANITKTPDELLADLKTMTQQLKEAKAETAAGANIDFINHLEKQIGYTTAISQSLGVIENQAGLAGAAGKTAQLIRDWLLAPEMGVATSAQAKLYSLLKEGGLRNSEFLRQAYQATRYQMEQMGVAPQAVGPLVAAGIERVGDVGAYTAFRLEGPLMGTGELAIKAGTERSLQRAKAAQAIPEAAIPGVSFAPEPRVATVRIGRKAYAIDGIEKRAAQLNVKPGDVVSEFIAEELATAIPKTIEFGEDFGRRITNVARSENITPVAAAMRLVSYELENMSRQGSKLAAVRAELPKPGAKYSPQQLVDSPVLAEALGYRAASSVPREALPPIRKVPLDGGKKAWGFQSDAGWVRIDQVGKKQYVARLGSDGEILKETAGATPTEVRRLFVEQQALKNSVSEPVKIGIDVPIEIPVIDGMSREAVLYGMAQSIVGKGAGVTVRGQGSIAGEMAAVYQQIVNESPVVRAIADPATRNAVVSGIIAERMPRVEFTKAVEGAKIPVMGQSGKVEMFDASKLIGSMSPLLELDASTNIRVLSKMIDAGMVSPGAFKENALQFLSHVGVNKAALKSLLKSTPDKIRGALREEAILAKSAAGVSRGAMEEAIARASEKAKGADMTELVGLPEWEYASAFSTANPEAVKMLKQRTYTPPEMFRVPLAEFTPEKGAAARRLHQAVLGTSQEHLFTFFSNRATQEALADITLSLRGQAALATNAVRSLLNDNILPKSAESYIAGVLGGLPDISTSAARVSAVREMLKNVEAFEARPELVGTWFADLVRKEGWQKAADVWRKGAGKDGVAPPKALENLFVHPDTGRAIEMTAQGRKGQGWNAAVASWLKYQQLVGRPAAWVRDYASSRFVLGPAAGFDAGDVAYSIAGRMLESSNAFRSALVEKGLLSGWAASESGAVAVAGLPPAMTMSGKTLLALDDMTASLAKYKDHPGLIPMGMGKLAEAGLQATLDMRKLPVGKKLAYERGFTDAIPRMALMVRETINRAKIASPAEVAALVDNMKAAGLQPSFLRRFFSADDPAAYMLEAMKKVHADAYRSAAKQGKPRAMRYRAGQEAVGQLVEETLDKLWTGLSEQAQWEILNKVENVFVKYTEKGRVLDAMSKNPWTNMYMTFTARAVPMVLKSMWKHPVRTLARKLQFDIADRLAWSMMSDEGDIEAIKRGVPAWMLPAVLGPSWAEARTGPLKYRAGLGLDMAWIHPFNFTLDFLRLTSSPLGGAVSQIAQALSNKPGEATKASYPATTDPAASTVSNLFIGAPGGANLSETNLGYGERLLQTAAGTLAGALGDVNPVNLLTTLAAWAGVRTAPGAPAKPGAPGKPDVPEQIGAALTPGWKGIQTALQGPASPTQTTLDPILAAARLGGMKFVPLSEKGQLANYVAPLIDGAQDASVRKALKLASTTQGKSPLGYAYETASGMSGDYINLVLTRSGLTESEAEKFVGDVSVPKKFEAWRLNPKMRRVADRIATAVLFANKTNAKLKSVLDEFAGVIVGQMFRSPSTWIYKADKVDMVIKKAIAITGKRTLQQVQDIIEGDAYTSFGVIDETAYREALLPVTQLLGSGLSFDDPQQAFSEWYGSQFQKAATGQKITSKADAAAQYLGSIAQSRELPEATMRTVENKPIVRDVPQPFRAQVLGGLPISKTKKAEEVIE